MYKVYYNDSVILLGEFKTLPSKSKTIKVYSYPEDKVATIWKRLKKDRKTKKVYICGNAKKILKALIAQCNLVKAAGGLVKNKSGEYLLIFRNKKWDLPKGKIEKRERVRTAAKREVEEECGIKRLRIVCPLQVSYHIYTLGGKLNIKHTQWYEMQYSGDERTKPQREEGIEKAIWVKKKDVSKLKKNMYPLIADILMSKKILA